MRVFLARPSYSTAYAMITSKTRSTMVMPPNGLMCVAGALERAGHEVSIADGEGEQLSTEAIVERAVAFGPAVVGVGATIVDFEQANEMLADLKERLGVHTILGGPHGTILADEILRKNAHIDVVVRGEGEETAVELFAALENGGHLGSIQGLSHRENGSIRHNEDRGYIKDLGTLAPPARHLIRPELYLYPDPRHGMKRMMTVQTSRGCPFRCGFCYHMFGRHMRFRPFLDVVDELEECVNRYGAEWIVFVDDTFTLNQKRVMAICEEIVRRGIGVSWFCLARADTLREDMLAKMREAGCVQVSIGVESGNQEILDSVHKGTKLAEVKRAFVMLKRLGFETRGSFILGLPYENRRTIRKTINFAKRLKLDRAFFNICTPYPGTDVWDNAVAGDGCTLLTHDWAEFKRHGNAVIELPDLSREELIDLQRVAMMEFYLRWPIVRDHLVSFFRGAREGFYYRPLWFAVKERIRRTIAADRPRQYSRTGSPQGVQRNRRHAVA